MTCGDLIIHAQSIWWTLISDHKPKTRSISDQLQDLPAERHRSWAASFIGFFTPAGYITILCPQQMRGQWGMQFCISAISILRVSMTTAGWMCNMLRMLHWAVHADAGCSTHGPLYESIILLCRLLIGIIWQCHSFSTYYMSFASRAARYKP